MAFNQGQLEYATGALLSEFGDEINVARNGDDDHEYRQRIKAEVCRRQRRKLKVDIQPSCEDGVSGMTLRDYFAARAMQGFMSRQLIAGFDDDMISERSYVIADAMLAAREVAQ